jgi:hypothetical protein
LKKILGTQVITRTGTLFAVDVYQDVDFILIAHRGFVPHEPELNDATGAISYQAAESTVAGHYVESIFRVSGGVFQGMNLVICESGC